MHVFFDVDGCISDDRHRLHLIGDDSYNEYHLASHVDDPMNLDVVQWHVERGDTIHFLTCRPAGYIWRTRGWLRENVVPLIRGNDFDFDYQIHMRGNGDKRSSPDCKVALLSDVMERQGIRADGMLVYDNRQDVIDKLHAVFGPCALRMDHEHRPVPNELMSKSTEIGYGPATSPAFTIPVGDVADQPDPDDEDLGIPFEPTCESGEPRVSAILREAADTFAERNQVYKSNYRQMRGLMKALFPDGFPEHLVFTNQWHLFELILVKITRFANSELTHKDSMRDSAVYCAMIESLIEEDEECS